jgi:DNA-binding Xre family transcriptional regulator
MTVKLKVRELRITHPEKPSQRFMGDLLGMTESNYRKLESNVLESVKLDYLDKLVKFYNCKLDEILEYVND